AAVRLGNRGPEEAELAHPREDLAMDLPALVPIADVGQDLGLGERPRGLLTADGVRTWYRTLDRPGWNPPDRVFGPVWTALYATMAASVAARRTSIRLAGVMSEESERRRFARAAPAARPLATGRRLASRRR
ncbi:MAG TPA: TspO/MBR family protein, partial [Candidatus Limnocylindrales bacterium]